MKNNLTVTDKAKLLIDYLSDWEDDYSFRCFPVLTQEHLDKNEKPDRICENCFQEAIREGLCRTFPDPVKIGDVLEKRRFLYGNPDSLLFETLVSLGQLWQPLGFTKSLNEIFEEVEHKNCEAPDLCKCDPDAQALLSYLWTIFSDQILSQEKNEG